MEYPNTLRGCISTLNKNKLPEVVDLFSGCGGLALGFQQTGFRITHGIELMENAVKNINYNLGVRQGSGSTHVCGDITQMDEKELKKKIGPEGCIVIGGPPCQAYSLAGRAKINSLREEGCYLDDKRGYLFEDFLRFGIGLDARAIVMENVRQCTSYGKLNVPERVAKILSDHHYKVRWTILNAADYGVPQIRERMILIALKGDTVPVLPKPTHSGKKFNGLYATTEFQKLMLCNHFTLPEPASDDAPPWLTVEDAIGDMPSLHVRATEPYHSYPMNLEMPYQSEPENDYQSRMRGDLTGVTGNVYRNTPRDYPIFGRMREGDNYVQASEIAEQILKEKCDYYDVQEGTPEYAKLKEKTVPPYCREKFLSKWKKLDRTKPSHTLVAHLSVDTYSHIHPWEPRGISVREAARLQSFPDDYIFHSNMGNAYKQIGNSVPPLMAAGIARAVRAALNQQEKNQGACD